MTSIFATFRRPKKKDSLSGGGDSLGQKPSSVFSSTPNLLKIDQNRIHPKNKVLVDNNSSSSSKSSATGWGGFDHRRASLSKATTMESITMGPTPPPPPPPPSVGMSTSLKKSAGGGSMRRFMSMANILGSLKRSKSIRRLGWESTSVRFLAIKYCEFNWRIISPFED